MNTESLDRLRETVRAFLAEDRAAGGFSRGQLMDGRPRSRVFWRLGARGWIGMTWPSANTAVAAGQRARALRRHRGTARRRSAGGRALVRRPPGRAAAAALRHRGATPPIPAPRSPAGQCFFAIGMSEPDSGSDLATSAPRPSAVDGGWRVRGTKVWTSHAHRSDFMMHSLPHRPPRADDRHDGLSQLIIDLARRRG